MWIRWIELRVTIVDCNDDFFFKLKVVLVGGIEYLVNLLSWFY